MAVYLLCQTITRTQTIERVIDVEFQQIGWVRGQPPWGRRLGPLPIECLQMQGIDEGKVSMNRTGFSSRMESSSRSRNRISSALRFHTV
jgi:hypothetical protein